MLVKDIILAVVVMAVWGFNFVVIKVGLDDFPPLLFSSLRFALAAFPLIFFIGRPSVPWRYIIGIGLMLGVAQFGLLFVGMSQNPIWGGMPAGLASLVLQTQAFFTVLFAVIIFREKPRLTQIVGIAIAFAGIGSLALEKGQSSPIRALGLVIAAAAFWGISNILMKHVNSPDIFRLIVWVSVIPPLPLLALSWLLEGPSQIFNSLTHLSLKGVGALGYIAFLSTIAGFGIWGRLLRRYEANLIAPFTLLVPVFGMTSAALVLHEHLNLRQGIASALVLFGLVLNMWKVYGAKLAKLLRGDVSSSR